MPESSSLSKKKLLSVSPHIIKFPEQQEEQQLSYQTNKLAQYIQLQLSDLQSTLHYIQKKHSINQIKQSISNCYIILSETQPIFRQLRINFVYQKIKKLVNCFSIIYLILMNHIQKSSTFSEDVQISKGKQKQGEGSSSCDQNIKSAVKYKNGAIKQQPCAFGLDSGKKAKPLGGIHLYNEQYNRHIQSDVDRLKKKLKEQTKQVQESSNPRFAEKQRFKEQIFKEINTDVYGSPSPDELTLFFNLNSNKYGSQLQYITFQDQLQQIAAFFKQSQDEAIQFLNKSRDDFIFTNFNQGFKQALTQYKIQKEGQVNGFVGKVKNLFEVIKSQTSQKQRLINLKLIQLKRLQERINKPMTCQAETQTSFNFKQQILRLKGKIQQLQSNYNSLRDYRQNQNENQQKNATYLQHRIAFKDHQVSFLKNDLQQKSHFINFLNEKINKGTDPKLLRKISNLYKNNTKKNSNKLKVQLQLLEKQSRIDLRTFANRGLGRNQNELARKGQTGKTLGLQQQQQQAIQIGKIDTTVPIQQLQAMKKKKRKPMASFLASPQKRFTSIVQRNAPFNQQNQRISEVNSHIQRLASGDVPLFEDNGEWKNDENPSSQKQLRIWKQQQGLASNDQTKQQGRNQLQVQKPKPKVNELQGSSFACGISNTKLTSIQNGSTAIRGINPLNQNSISEQSEQNITDQYEQMIREISKRPYDNQDNSLINQEDSYKSSLEDDSLLKQASNLLQTQGIDFLHQIVNKNQQPANNLPAKNKYPNLNKLASQIQDQSKNSKQPVQMRRLSKQHQARNRNKVCQDKQSAKKQRDSNLMRGQDIIQTIQCQDQILKEQKIHSSIKKYLGSQTQGKDVEKRFRSFQTINQNFISSQCSQSQRYRQQKIYSDSSSRKGSSKELEEKQVRNARQINQDQLLTQKQTKQFIKAISELSSLSSINVKQKQKIISKYFGSLYKQQKTKTSTLNSKMIDITVAGSGQKQNICSQPAKIFKRTQNQVMRLEQNMQLKYDVSRMGNQARNSRIQDNSSALNRNKNLSAQKLAYLQKNTRGKLSHLTVKNNLLKYRESKIGIQNLTLHKTTLHDVNSANQNKQEQNLDGSVRNQEQLVKWNHNKENDQGKGVNQVQYERVHGIRTTVSRTRLQTPSSHITSQYEKEKTQQYLQKMAVKLAAKSKNIEQFRAKVKKMHFTKCGQTCKHLQRYVQNYSRYKLNHRQAMKIHIQDVNHTVSHHQPNHRQIKQNSVNFPNITGFNNTVNSSKHFSYPYSPAMVTGKK